MKLLYTIKIFEFTLTKNGHFGFVCLRTEMVSVDYLRLYIKWISLSRLGEAGADPTFYNISVLPGMLRENGKGLIGKGGRGGQTKLCEFFTLIHSEKEL